MAESSNGNAKQVLVKLVTKLPADLRVPETPIAVPANIKRYGLSQIINHLLALAPARPFDFIVDGELLRQALEAHLLQRNISAEAVLEVEYVPAVVPPKADHAAPHDDWVSAVDGRWGPAHVVSGSYDGFVRTWHVQGGGSAECTLSWRAHEGGVDAVACGPEGAQQQQQQLVYTAGKDLSLLMWRVLPEEGGQQLLARFAGEGGHTDAVQSVAVSPGGALLASGGWDGQLLLWKAGQQVMDAAAEAAATAPPAPAGKRRKGAAAAAAASAAAPEGGLAQAPVGSLHGQGGSQRTAVACAAWASDSVLYSGGWDHAARRWDAEAGVNTETYNGSKVVCALACAPQGGAGGGGVVALGCSDNVLRLWDVRTRATQEALSVKSCPSHAGWVVGLAWQPGSEHVLASASHDHTVKLWDTRSTVPLATLANHTDKALCVAWASPSVLCSGGADCKLLSYSSTA